MNKELLKKLLNGAGAPAAGRAALGAGGGAYLGHEVTPGLFGYEGDEAATNTSTMMDSLLYGTLGAMGGKGVSRLARKNPMAFAGSLAGSEMFPVGMHALQEGTEAIEGFNPPTAKEQIGSVLKSPESKGALGGTALAGLAALVTGMLRSKSEKERTGDSSRAGMVSSDFLKYLLPAMVAGGVLGNVSKDNNKPTA